MKIILITGVSGSGKTTIAKELCRDNRYNFISSYTDRPQREKNEFGHTFVSSNHMDFILEEDEIVAQTKIDEYRYCAIKSQFLEDKINVYIVDSYGISDTLATFSDANIMTLLIRRNEVEGDCVRLGRDVHVPLQDDVDFIIHNYKVETVSNLIKALVNFNLFSHPTYVQEGIQEKLDYIDEQSRYMEEIKTSLYTQLWYKNRDIYKEVCKHVEKQINDDFDFSIQIVPDDKPEIYDGYLNFNIIAEYDEDLMWTDMHRLVERLSYHAHVYCEEKEYTDLSYRLHVAEAYKMDDDYI